MRFSILRPRGAGPLCLLALLSSGCAFTRTPIPGLLVKEGHTPRETVDRIQDNVRQMEAVIKEKIPAAGPDGLPAPTWKARIAALKILDAYVALVSETLHSHTGLDPFDYTYRRKPLYLYPRATSPILAECVRAGAAEPEWILPVILNKRAFAIPSRPSWALGSLLGGIIPDPDVQIPEDPEEFRRMMREAFHFALFPRDFERRVEVPLDEAPAGYIEIPRIEITVREAASRRPGAPQETSTTTFQFPVRSKDLVDLVFGIPASRLKDRWERKTAATGSEVHGELFDLRAFPRIPFDPPPRPAPWGDVLRGMKEGRWLAVHDSLSHLDARLAASDGAVEGLGLMPEDCEAVAKGIESFLEKFVYFDPELRPVAERARKLGRALEGKGDVSATQAVQDLQMEIGKFVYTDPCLGPVFLDEPEPKKRSFSFIVGADVQYDTDASNLQQFLAMIDATRVPQTASGPPPFGDLTGGLTELVRQAKFVLLVGDIGDGQGFSSTPNAMIEGALGLNGVWSPYVDGTTVPKQGEFPELREQFRRCSIPILAVPGNHDGFCAFGGILNQVAATVGTFLEALPLFGLAGRPLRETVAPSLPTLVRFWRIAPPFYDGLVDWTLEMGSHNLAFNYRGCTLVALNSFDLHQLERDQVGAIGNNWGGGLQEETLVWFDLALRHFSGLDREARGTGAAPPSSFIFMHHDPRASIASKQGYVEAYFGRYNDITSPMNELTLGYFGMSWANFTGLYIPIVSPFFVGALREASFGENFQERWMRHNAWDEECYNAKGLLEAINRNLEGAPPITSSVGAETYPPARISHIFFAHDDTPVIGQWVHLNGDTVFPGQPSDIGWDPITNTLFGIYRRSQTENAPGWAREMRFGDGRNATVVRLDDIGDSFSRVNSHGFSLVTVVYPEDESSHPSGQPLAEPLAAGRGPRVEVRWIPVPR